MDNRRDDSDGQHGSESGAGRTLEHLRALVSSLFTAQEEERRRVARELHDDVSQKLAVLEIDVQQIETRIAQNPGQAQADLAKVRLAIAALSEDVRNMSRTLHPSVIDDLGIAPALRALVDDFRDRERMIVTCTAQDLPDNIPTPVATGLYRIAQEALRNVAKHAGRTHVRIILKGESGRVRLQIFDYGDGFDQQARRSGLGLISMEERALILDGTFSVESHPFEGTRVTVDVPLTNPTP